MKLCNVKDGQIFVCFCFLKHGGIPPQLSAEGCALLAFNLLRTGVIQ